MTEDALARKILKFVRQLDGGETDQRVLEAAVARRWLDARGRPTADGRRLVDEFDTLGSIGRPTV